jgi:hypothetical protein
MHPAMLPRKEMCSFISGNIQTSLHCIRVKGAQTGITGVNGTTGVQIVLLFARYKATTVHTVFYTSNTQRLDTTSTER